MATARRSRSVTSTRAAGRARRAASFEMPGDAVGELFGCRAMSLDEAGIELIVDDVDLAATFGGW